MNPMEQRENEINILRQEIIQGVNVGTWWTWTQDDFNSWCNANLMSDAAIDGLTLGTALKTNLKANNAFTRNSGKLLIIARDIIKWLVRIY